MTRELLAVLPLLNRIVVAEVLREVDTEMPMPQFRVLAQLADGPLMLSTLAKKCRVSLQSMSELVQTLVERGWVGRLPDSADRRQYVLHLMEHGRAHYARAQHQMLQRLVPLIEKLRDAERAVIQIALPDLHGVLAQEEQADKETSGS